MYKKVGKIDLTKCKWFYTANTFMVIKCSLSSLVSLK